MKNLIFSALLLSLLAACASKEVKKEEPPKPVEAKPVVAEPPKPAPAPAPAPAKAEPAPAPAPVAVNPLTDPNNILSKRNVYYDFDKYFIKPEFKPMIEAHGRYLNEHRDARITVEGNCDERGSREYNLGLGQRRADSVKKALGVLGVAESRIETLSYGEEKPRCTGHNEACWGQNRRSDIKYQGE